VKGLQKGLHHYLRKVFAIPQAALAGLSGGHCRVLQRSEGQEALALSRGLGLSYKSAIRLPAQGTRSNAEEN